MWLRQALGILAERFPEMAAAVKPAQPSVDIVPARSGEPSARLAEKPLFLHSRYDPRAEAAKAVSEALAGGADLLVLAGLGLGYAAEAALSEGAMVVALEPDPGVLKACLGARDLSPVLSNPRFTLLPVEALPRFLENSEARAIALLENPATAGACPEGAAAIRAAFDRSRQKDRINTATLKRFGRRWVRNLAANTHAMALSSGLGSMGGAFAGIPALVLAAGPSLDEVLPLLPQLRERCLLICVDTALRSVLRIGLQPDICVVVDPQYWNARHLDRCDAPRSFLVTEPAVWPSVFRGRFRRILTCASLYPLGQYLDRAMGVARGTLGAGGSVATSAWDLARLAGCDPVFMAGLDLSFPDGKTHAKASLFEQRSLNRGTRLKPAATEGFEAYRGGQPYEAPANDGSTVVTDRRLSLYSWWFSAKAERYPLTRTFNLSARGLAIPGLAPAGPERIMDLPARRPEVDAALDALDRNARPCADPSSVDIAVSDLVEELGKLAGLAEEARALAESARLGGSTDLSRLDAIDRAITGSKASDIVGFLFGSVEDVLGGRSRNLDEALAKTADIYRAASESARWHASILSRGA